MPKGGASSLTPVHAGLQEDLDAFLKAYLTTESMRFTDYKKLFEHRGMIQLLSGRSNSSEIIEFNECLLVYCLQYMKKFVCPGVPRCLKERLFGLYSLYTFYYVQQENHVVKIRMDPDASSHFRLLAELVFNERIFDAYMACLKLIEDKAIKHVAFITIHDPANFKRFYTDDKVTGVNILANLNDPMSNVKSLHESYEFLKLGLIHTEYSIWKQRACFDGCQIINIHEKVNEIISQHALKVSMNYSGVDEIINTDHSSEQLASRGMLRASTKEQAYSADLKLTRSRRHRSSTPLDLKFDTFEFEDDSISEAKDVKRIKKELPSEAAYERYGDHKILLLGNRAEPSSPEEGIAKKKCRLFDNNSIREMNTDDYPIVYSPSSHLSEVEYEEILPVDRKPDKILWNANGAQMTAEMESREFREGVDTLDEMEMYQQMDKTQHYDSQKKFEMNYQPKSIIKTEKGVSSKSDRHVIFRETHDGELDTTVHEIPHQSCYENGSEEVKQIKLEMKPTFDVPQLSDSEHQPVGNNSYDALLDVTDMFKPIEAEDDDDMSMDDNLMAGDSDDELMIVDDM